MNIDKLLTFKDSIAIIELCHTALSCSTQVEFEQLILRLKQIVGFDTAFCTYLTFDEQIEETNIGDVIFLDFPVEFMHRYEKKGYVNQDLVTQAFLATGELQNWGEVTEKYNNGKKTIIENEAGEYGIRDGWTYGIRHSSGMANFSFACEKSRDSERSREIIKLTVPHLAESFKRIIQSIDVQKTNITPRELEILNWLKIGKSSWEISKILKISERSVNFHVNNIKRKLDAANRVHAVALSIGKGIIEF